ncbi:MAG: hypothetical protein AAB131_08265, partial [Actinomycetota bacterium]
MASLTSGAKYKIYVRALNTAGHILNTGLNVSTHVFVYDVTSPTITAHYSILSLSTSNLPGDPSNIPSLIVASGTVSDNISDSLDPRRIFLQIFDVTTGKYLNPATLIKFDVVDGNAAWAETNTTTNTWTYDLSLSQFVSGNQYKVEIYGGDAAGNSQWTARGANTGCPVTLNSDTFCQTGVSTGPKYVRYFRYNKLPPTIAIVTPITTSPNNMGAGALTTITGVTTDPGGSGINHVEYSLKFADSSQRWVTYTSTAGAWKTAAQQPTDYWNYSCDPVVGCGSLGGTWSVWQSSNIAWIDSTAYTFEVRAVDASGNVSNINSISFTYDISKPNSYVTSPTNQQAYATRTISPITGTAVDEVSTGTPSGMNADFRVGIKRLSDNYWWDGSTWTAQTFGIYESSIAVAMGTGVGTKNWNLTLSSTFYDLLGATDTFKVFSWAKDLVINPSTAAANVESSTTVKAVFSYGVSTPTLTSQAPAANSASNVAASVDLVFNPQGGRINQIWAAFLDTSPAGPYYWTGSSWSDNGTVDPPSTSSLVWLSTEAAAPGTPSPDMIFTPGSVPDGSAAVTVSFTGATSLVKPAWADGRKYKIYVRARNTAGQELNTSSLANQVFLYDVTAPTMTAHYNISSLSTSSLTGDVSALTGFSLASGTVRDNVSDPVDSRQIVMRIQDQSTLKYLNPNTLTNFDVTAAGSAWATIPQTADEWAYDLSSAKYVAGNVYMLELYANDVAGNEHTVSCPTTSLSAPGACQTGNSGSPKYIRYFKVDRTAPTLTISTPTVSVPFNIGSPAALATISGTAEDVGFGLAYVEYKLAFNTGDPTNHWLHHVTSGSWQTGYVGDIWNRACDATVGCGQPGGTWAVWKSSNISWIESQNYVFTVRSVDLTGSVSTEKTLTFNYDIAAPQSLTGSPAANAALTSRAASITGTVQDQISTGTPSGTDSTGFRVAVKRLSDNYWWNGSTWTVPTGAVYESSMSILVGAGVGAQAWSLPLSSTFYDLLGATDTFKVYAWGTDLSNNPPGSAHVESSTTVKLVFSYASSTPTLTGQSPAANSASNVAASVVLNVDPVGGRIVQVWAAFLDTSVAGPYYWTGSSWSANGTVDPPTTASAVWLSTDSQVSGSPTPDMIFTPGTAVDGLTVATITFSGATSLVKPAWADGRKYKIYVRARNTAGQELNTSSLLNQVFIYDVTSPTLTVHQAVRVLSTSAVAADVTALTGFSIASGTIRDNVSDDADNRQVFMRIQDQVTLKYLNPNTLVNFDVVAANASSAWALTSLTDDEWDFDLSGAKYVAGNAYKIELYANDVAGNEHAVACPTTSLSAPGTCQTGNSGSPKYIRYFKVDRTVPTLAISTPTVSVPFNIGAYSALATITGTADDVGFGLDYVEYSLRFNADDPTNHWLHHQSSGEWKTGYVGDIWKRACDATVGCGHGGAFTTWISSNIAWIESKGYVFTARAVDLSGSVSVERTLTFNYDIAAPQSLTSSPAANAALTSRAASITGTVEDQVSTGTPAGMDSTSFRTAVQRLSDNYWWNGSTWTVPTG